MSTEPAVRRGDIVIVELDPAEGHGMKKTWPAVVVQNDVGNKSSSTTIIAPATCTFRGSPFEILVEESDTIRKRFVGSSGSDPRRFDSAANQRGDRIARFIDHGRYRRCLEAESRSRLTEPPRYLTFGRDSSTIISYANADIIEL